MDKFVKFAEEFIQQCDLKTFALMKLCLVSFGVLCGLKLYGEGRKAGRVWAGLVFWASYLPLMARLASVLGLRCPCCRDKKDADSLSKDAV